MMMQSSTCDRGSGAVGHAWSSDRTQNCWFAEQPAGASARCTGVEMALVVYLVKLASRHVIPSLIQPDCTTASFRRPSQPTHHRRTVGRLP